MPSTNPDFMSQFPDTELGNALRSRVEQSQEFYREYVTCDHNHEYVSRISRTAAMALVQSSPYRPLLTSYMVDHLACDDLTSIPTHIMNKGAIRITPTADWVKLIRGLHVLSELPDEGSELWDNYRGWLNGWWKHDEERFEIWVYNHDGKYYLSRPRKEEPSHDKRGELNPW